MWSSNGGRVASGTRGLSPARGAEPLQPAAGGGAPKPKLCDQWREGPSGSSRSAARLLHGPGAHDTAGGTAVRAQSRAFSSSCSRVRHTGLLLGKRQELSRSRLESADRQRPGCHRCQQSPSSRETRRGFEKRQR